MENVGSNRISASSSLELPSSSIPTAQHPLCLCWEPSSSVFLSLFGSTTSHMSSIRSQTSITRRPAYLVLPTQHSSSYLSLLVDSEPLATIYKRLLSLLDFLPRGELFAIKLLSHSTVHNLFITPVWLVPPPSSSIALINTYQLYSNSSFIPLSFDLNPSTHSSISSRHLVDRCAISFFFLSWLLPILSSHRQTVFAFR